ncbi:hypothetical protein [Streptomyces roseolus]|uniref:hypothetical protein n=1 Tax=Streptomyces roseolus TaxID=67358 RepID=UPI0037A1D281
MADPGTVEFGGRRGDRRRVVVVAGAEQLPGDRTVLLLAQRRDTYALRLQQLLRLAVSSLRQHPHLPLVLSYRLDPHQVVVLKIQEVVPYELVVLVVRAGGGAGLGVAGQFQQRRLGLVAQLLGPQRVWVPSCLTIPGDTPIRKEPSTVLPSGVQVRSPR